MSLADQVNALATRVATEFKRVRIPVQPGPPPNPVEGQLWIDEDAVASSPSRFHVGTVNPGMTSPGMWIETGVGPSGEDFTIWIEDGT